MTGIEQKLRAGVQLVGGPQWLGGVTYSDLLVRALTSLPPAMRPEVTLLIDDKRLENWHLFAELAKPADRLLYVGTNARKALETLPTGVIAIPSRRELSAHIDAVYPFQAEVWPEIPGASWIPDFQHLHLPQFFSQQEIASRDRQFAQVAERARLVVFSSHDALGDFRNRYPGSQAITRVLPFYWPAEQSWFLNDPEGIRAKHGVPQEYFICCNQFWAHKDHATLFRALGLLEKEGRCPKLVLTGATEDYRNPGYFPSLMQIAEEEGITDRLRLLGHIPRGEQIQLIRSAKAMVQPSRFEGWSTVVEDARALGKAIVLTDLAVHREQNPPGARFFTTGDARELADRIAEVDAEFPRGPHPEREEEARQLARFNSARFARRLLLILRESLTSPSDVAAHEWFTRMHGTLRRMMGAARELTSFDEEWIAATSADASSDEGDDKTSRAAEGLTRLARHYRERGQGERAAETAQRAVMAGANDEDIRALARQAG